MAHNVKQVTIAKIYFPSHPRNFRSLSMSLHEVLFLNCLKRSETYIIVVGGAYKRNKDNVLKRRDKTYLSIELKPTYHYS